MAWSDIVTAPPPQAPGPKPTPEQLANLPSAAGYASPQLPPGPQMQQAMPVDVPLPRPGLRMEQAMPVDVPLPEPGEVSPIGHLLNSPSLGAGRLEAQINRLRQSPSQNGQKKEPTKKEETAPEIPGAVLVKPADSSADTTSQKPTSSSAPEIPGAVLVKPADTARPTQATAPEQIPQIPGATLIPETQPPQPPQQPATPTPSGTGVGAPPANQQLPVTYPTIAEDQPDTQEQLKALVQQGHSPGASQAIVAGQQPKTLNGETPPPKPAPAPKTEQPQQAQGETVDWGRLGYKSFEDYQQFVAGLGVEKAVRGPGTTATLVGQAEPSQPSATTTTQPEELPKVIGGNRIQGISTIFGLNYDGSVDPDDNGRGFFGGVNTRNPKLKAVAVPVDVLEKTFGHFAQVNAQGGYDMVDTPEARAVVKQIQSAHVEAIGADGKIHKFPIVDIQGSLKGHPGKALDLTYGAAKDMGFTDNHNISYQIISGDGKPYPIPDNIEFAGGGGGKGGGRLGGEGTLPGPEDSLAGQPMISVPSSGGGGGPRRSEEPSPPRFGGYGGGGGETRPETQTTGSSIDLSPLVAADILSNLFRGGGRPQAAQPSEEKGPSPSDVVTRVLAAGGPPPAPGAEPVDLSTMKQANVLGVRTLGAPQLGLPAPPAAPGPDPIVIKALMKRGFTRAQAEAFAAKATVSKPGAAAIAGAASFRKPAQLPAPPPAAPAPQPPAAAKPPPTPAPPVKAAGAPPTELPQPQKKGKLTRFQRSEQAMRQMIAEREGKIAPPAAPPTRIGPEGSTIGVPNPPGGPSPDDPRVKKQKDNLTKGEHFVPGDDFHDQLLNGLPGGQGGRQRQLLAQAEAAIADKTPMHLSYLSAPKEAAKFPTRESRTVQYDEHSPEARLLGTTEGQLVGHSFIPTAVGVSPSRKAGEPHQSYIQGLSTNVIANNFEHLNAKLAAMGEKTPYASFGPKFANDLEGYLSNLIAGHTGTGRGHALGTAEYPNEPDTSHVPYKLSRHEADFLNTVINNTGAFAKHEDAKALRELARINGTLITPEGETNRLRHQIEQHEPGWRNRVLEPSIRSFKTGLIHDVHPSEEHMPATIRPGQGYRDVTAAMARTSHRGRPDVPVSVSLHHTFADNKAINQIERDFSEKRIDEHEARARLHAMGEDPDEYRFVGGSGGLITPYEENPEAITPEEHSQLKDNLRKQWIDGKLNVEDYRRKAAEVPLPELPSRPATQTPLAEKETPSEESVTPPKPKSPTPAAPTAEEARDALEQLGSGKFDRHLEKYAQAQDYLARGEGALTQQMRKAGILAKGDPDHGSDAEALAHWIDHHDIVPRQKNGEKYSANTNLLLRVLSRGAGGGVLKMQGGGVVPDPAPFALSSGTQIQPPLTMPPAPPAPSLAPKAQPVVPKAQPVNPQPAPPADPTQFGGLANVRGTYVKELDSNPGLMLRLTNLVDREVGDQSPQKQQAFLEGVINRAASRKMTLNDTVYSLHDPANGQNGYYPHPTFDHLDDPLTKGKQGTQQLQTQLGPILQNIWRGSNTAKYGTGNQGVDRDTGKYITSDDAEITVPHKKFGDDDIIIENRDQDWANTMRQEEADWRAHGQPVAGPTVPGGPPTGINIMGGYNQPVPRAVRVVPGGSDSE